MTFMVENIYQLPDDQTIAIIENIRINAFKTAKKHEEWYKSSEDKKNKSKIEIKINGIVNGYLRRLYTKEVLIERLAKCLEEADNFEITAGGYTFNLINQIAGVLGKNDTRKDEKTIIKSLIDIYKEHPDWENSTNENEKLKFKYLKDKAELAETIINLDGITTEHLVEFCIGLYKDFITKNLKIHQGKSIWTLLNDIRNLTDIELTDKEQSFYSPEMKLTFSFFKKIEIQNFIEYHENFGTCFDVTLMCLYFADVISQLTEAKFKQVKNVHIKYNAEKTRVILTILDANGNKKECNIPYFSGMPAEIFFSATSLTSIFNFHHTEQPIIEQLKALDSSIQHIGLLSDSKQRTGDKKKCSRGEHFFPLMKIGQEWVTWEANNNKKFVILTMNNGEKLTEYAEVSFRCKFLRITSVDNKRKNLLLETLSLFRKNIFSEEQSEELNNYVSIKLIDLHNPSGAKTNDEAIADNERVFYMAQTIEREKIYEMMANQ